ncbi:MAG: hypothetical protein AAF388_27855 [Bacteroidota bacterium]
MEFSHSTPLMSMRQYVYLLLLVGLFPLSSFAQDARDAKELGLVADAFPERVPLPELNATKEIPTEWHLEFTASGCFHYEKKVLTFSQEKAELTLQENKSPEITYSLTESQIEKIIIFTEELLSKPTHEGKCTTVDSYTLTFLEEEVWINDGTCNWNGMRKLLSAIVREEK